MFTHLSSHKQTIIRRTFIKQYFYRKTTTKIICYFNNAIEEKWIKNGKFHRAGAPARIVIYHKELHRSGDAPVCILIYHKAWLQNGKLHCSGDVPAYIEYYKNGQNYTENWYKNDKRHRIRNVQFKCNNQQIK